MTKNNFSLKACVGVVLTSTVSQCLFDISWEGSLGPVIQFTLSLTVNCGLFFWQSCNVHCIRDFFWQEIGIVLRFNYICCRGWFSRGGRRWANYCLRQERTMRRDYRR